MTAAATALPTRKEFSDQVNSTFRATGPGGEEFEVELIAFEEIVDSETQENFSLMFRAPLNVPAQQGIFTIRNSDIAAQEIFMVPVRTDESGFYFEAVFNRFKNK